MKSASIITIAILALVSLCQSLPIADENAEIQTLVSENSDLVARTNAVTFLYDNILKDLFSGLVTNTFGHISNTLNNLIQTNPLAIGKREAEEDWAARAGAFTFLYDNILKDLFNGLVTNTFGHISNTLNNLIETNPLGIGKRDTEEDLAARADALTFLYDNILKDLFSGLVTNAFGHIGSTLNNLIQTNPLGIGKREAEEDWAARAGAFTFLYDNILKDLFSGLVTNTFGHIGNTLNNLIETNPLGIGKRNAEDDWAARAGAFTFLYDNILKDLFNGLVTNTFGHISNTLNNLIETNPLGIGKREAEEDWAARADALTFLYDNILKDLFSGLVTNAFGHVGSTLNNLIQTNPLGIGKRASGFDIEIFANLFNTIIANTAQHVQNTLNNIFAQPNANLRSDVVNIQQAKTIAAEVVSTLVEKLKTFAHEAVANWNDRQKLIELVKENVAFVKTTVNQLAQQLSQVIPSTVTAEVSQALGALQSLLVFWTSGLGGSLGPVIGPFPQ